ncbi:hypothetical protein WJX74_001789 [Apatococcus lobatus]|uniref:S-adenosyl-L-methionine-dependent methyltransferase n=1 Tax=Apatococcus lobatus TaxID=904363 RepID=A0AAW1RPH8_9CHLO
MAGIITWLYQAVFKLLLSVVELNVVPDLVIRQGIRFLLGQRLAKERQNPEPLPARLQQFVAELKKAPIAQHTDEANVQHYEVPTSYFLTILGKRLKYSSCLYEGPTDSLDMAEVAMLETSCQRAELKDGQAVLDLGCGWGSLSLYMAQRFPGSQITALSNSSTQRQFIETRARTQGLTNLKVVTADVVKFQGFGANSFDRVVSIEMFEHMKNYQALLKKVSGWLKPHGKLFVHHFCHKRFFYNFEVQGEDDWMTKYFFLGGTMMSFNLLEHFQDDLAVDSQWWVSGNHYSRTLEDWLVKHDQHRSKVAPIMEATYGKASGLKWFVYWRLFYLACSELFGYNGGTEYGISHVLMRKK